MQFGALVLLTMLFTQGAYLQALSGASKGVHASAMVKAASPSTPPVGQCLAEGMARCPALINQFGCENWVRGGGSAGGSEGSSRVSRETGVCHSAFQEEIVTVLLSSVT